MRIAVNTSCLIPNLLEGCGHFTAETFKLITQQHPEHTFFFLFDRPYDEQFIFSKNITPIVVNPRTHRVTFFKKWWYDLKVSAILRKIKADVFLSTDGLCNLDTKVPQIQIIHDLAFLHFPNFIKKSHSLFYNRHIPRCIKKAKLIVTISEFSKKDIVQHYNTDAAKICVVGSGAREIFQPIDWKQKEVVKEKYTDGKEYFLYVGSICPRKNVINLLKAFSLFKKRQQSNMQLLIAGRMAWQNDEFKEKLETYKYRNEIKLLGYVEDQELSKLVGAAYALVYPSLFEGFALPLIEAMQCEVPMITSNSSSMPEVAGTAALYADPNKPEDIAEQMKMIYKDEMLRTQLIEEGKEQIKKFNWQKTADALWNCIENVCFDGSKHIVK